MCRAVKDKSLSCHENFGCRFSGITEPFTAQHGSLMPRMRSGSSARSNADTRRIRTTTSRSVFYIWTPGKQLTFVLESHQLDLLRLRLLLKLIVSALLYFPHVSKGTKSRRPSWNNKRLMSGGASLKFCIWRNMVIWDNAENFRTDVSSALWQRQADWPTVRRHIERLTSFM